MALLSDPSSGPLGPCVMVDSVWSVRVDATTCGRLCALFVENIPYVRGLDTISVHASIMASAGARSGGRRAAQEILGVGVGGRGRVRVRVRVKLALLGLDGHGHTLSEGRGRCGLNGARVKARLRVVVL